MCSKSSYEKTFCYAFSLISHNYGLILFLFLFHYNTEYTNKDNENNKKQTIDKNTEYIEEETYSGISKSLVNNSYAILALTIFLFYHNTDIKCTRFKSFNHSYLLTTYTKSLLFLFINNLIVLIQNDCKACCFHRTFYTATSEFPV